MKKTSSKEKRHYSSQVDILVVAALILSNLISIILIVNNSRILIRSSVKNNMMNMAKTSAELVSNEMRINNNKSLSYDEYARILKDTKLTGVDSSYVYVSIL